MPTTSQNREIKKMPFYVIVRSLTYTLHNNSLLLRFEKIKTTIHRKNKRAVLKYLRDKAMSQ